MPIVVLPSIFSSFLCGFFSHCFHLKSYCETQASLSKTEQRSSEVSIQANIPFSCKITEHGEKKKKKTCSFSSVLCLPVACRSVSYSHDSHMVYNYSGLAYCYHCAGYFEIIKPHLEAFPFSVLVLAGSVPSGSLMGSIYLSRESCKGLLGKADTAF